MLKRAMSNPIVILIVISVLSALLFLQRTIVNPLNFDLLDNNDQPTTIGKHLNDTDDYTVLVFWSNWCNGCNKQFNTLTQLVKQTPNLSVIAVHIGKARPKNNPSFPRLTNLRSEKDSERLMTIFSNNTDRLPLIVIFGKHSQIIKTFSGIVDLDQLSYSLKAHG